MLLIKIISMFKNLKIRNLTILIHPIILLFAFLIFSGNAYSQATCPVAASPELVTNGNFESGNTGFTFDPTLGYYSGSGGMSPNSIRVTNSPNALNSYYDNITDHTSGAGQMLVVDVGSNVGQDIYVTTVTGVTANTTYFFSSWFANLSSLINKASPTVNQNRTACALCPGGFSTNNPPLLRFSINNVQLGSTVRVDSLNSVVWQQFFTSWNSGATTGSVVLRIENIRGTGGGGNDVALDDISFTSGCSKINLSNYGRNSILPKTVFGCNFAYPYAVSSSLPGANFTFQWKNASNVNLTGTSNATSYSFTSAPPTGFYYLCYDSIADGLVCSKKDSVYFVNQLSASIQPNQIFCPPIAYTINPGINAPGVTYTWQRNGSPAGSGSTLLATATGTYRLDVSKAGCTSAFDIMTITSPGLGYSGTGNFCSVTGLLTFTGVNSGVINGNRNVRWYNVSIGGSAFPSQADNISAVVTTSSTISTPGCSYGLYAQDFNSFNATVGGLNGPSGCASGNQMAIGRLKQKFTVRTNLTLNSIDIVQRNYSNNVGTFKNYRVLLYADDGGNPSNSTGAPLQTTTVFSFQETTTATRRTLPLNFNITGITTSTSFWLLFDDGAGGQGGEIDNYNCSGSFPYWDNSGQSVTAINFGRQDNNQNTSDQGPTLSWRITTGNPSGCSRVFVCATPGVCPLSISYPILLSGKNDANTHLLQWSASKKFERTILESSANGETFIPLYTTSGSSSSFSYKTNRKYVYYRIKGIQNGQSEQYSDIVEISNLNQQTYSIAPNPIENEFSIFSSLPIGEEIQIEIYDNLGRIHSKFNYTGSSDSPSMITLPSENLQSGLYFLKIIDGKEQTVFKILKN